MICPRCQLGELQPGDTCPSCGHQLQKGVSPEDALLRELERVARADLAGQFDVERVLGRGGMSVVLLAREAELRRHVAVKVLPLQISFAPDAAERFKREARISASLDHPHIVPVHRVGATPRLLWYSMKYVRGVTLATHLVQSGPMTVDVTVRLMAKVAGALQYAHDKGIVHRDVKPGNVMLDERGWAWVTDFGVAKAFGNVPLTQTGSTLGTPGYMAPEQFYGKELDGRADQYSLAVVAFECLVGAPPFVAESLGEYVHKHCHVPAPDIRTMRDDIPERIATALLKALSKTPDERFASVKDFAIALGAPRDSKELPPVAAATEMEVPTTSPISTRAAAPTTPTPGAGPGPVRSGESALLRSPKRVVVLAAVLILITLGVLVIPGADTPSTTPSEEAPPASPAPEEPGTATLIISTIPIGRLLVDGRPAGESFRPAGVSLQAGQRILQVTRPGFTTWVDTVTVRAGDTVRRLAISLRPLR